MSWRRLLTPREQQETGDLLIWRRGLVKMGNRTHLTSLLRRDGKTIANYQPGNYTGTLNASAWANSIGAAPSLAQATGANQPIIVSADYVKKGYFPRVTSNGFSTPATAATKSLDNVTDMAFLVAPNNITTTYTLAGSRNTADSWAAFITNTGNLQYTYYIATVGHTDVSTAALSSAALQWGRIYHNPTTGETKFYTQAYTGSNIVPLTGWAQLGNTVAGTIGAVDADTGVTDIGRFAAADGNGLLGYLYRFATFWGDLTAGGVRKWDWNVSDWPETSTNGATQASSTTGEVWTLNNTGATPACIIARPRLACNGTNHLMQATYTANQPRTIDIVGLMPTWTVGKYVADGKSAANTLGLSKTTGSPKLSINAGLAAAENAGFTLLTRHVIQIVLNGASSSITVDGGTATTGDAGAGNPGGLTIGADGAGLNIGAFQFEEIIDRDGADSAAVLAQRYALLKAIYGTA